MNCVLKATREACMWYGIPSFVNDGTRPHRQVLRDHFYLRGYVMDVVEALPRLKKGVDAFGIYAHPERRLKYWLDHTGVYPAYMVGTFRGREHCVFVADSREIKDGRGYEINWEQWNIRELWFVLPAHRRY